MTAFTIDGEHVELDVRPNTPLLWVAREHLKLTGTKFGCGTDSRIFSAIRRAAPGGPR